jgi:hypothetical protein
VRMIGLRGDQPSPSALGGIGAGLTTWLVCGLQAFLIVCPRASESQAVYDLIQVRDTA